MLTIRNKTISTSIIDILNHLKQNYSVAGLKEIIQKNDEVIVTVIATGFEDSTEPLYRSMEGEKKASVMQEEDEELEMPAFLRNRDF